MNVLKKLLKKYFPMNWKTFVSPTIVATLILIITFVCFGMENSMIAPFVSVSYLHFINMKNHFSCMIRQWLIYCLIAIVSFVAVINLPLCILVNAGMLFFLSYIFTDEYHPDNYLPMGMALIFFQTASLHTLPQLLTRLEALTVSFGIILLFVLLTGLKYYEKDPIADEIKKGFPLAEQILDACKKQDDSLIHDLHLQINKINQVCSEEIYSYNRSTFLRKGKVNYYCRFVAFFQVFNYLTRHYQEKDNLQKAKNLLTYYQELLAEHKPQKDYWMLMLRNDKLNIRDFKFRFALREVITITPCLALALHSGGAQYAYWMVFSLFYMLTPTTDFGKKAVRDRVIGSLIGIIGSLVLFSIFPQLPARILITAILNLFIYSTAGDIATIAYICCATLSMQTFQLNTLDTMLHCIAATLIGAVIAMLVNRFLFVVHVDVQIERLLDRLAQIRQMLLESRDIYANEEKQTVTKPKKPFHYLLSRRYMNETERRHHFNDQLVIRSYLISRRIQDLDESRPVEQRDPALPELEKQHMLFMAEYLLYGGHTKLAP